MSDRQRVDRLGSRDALTVADVLSGRAPTRTITGRIRTMIRWPWPECAPDLLIELAPAAAIIASWGTIGYAYGGSGGLLAGALAGCMSAALLIVFVHWEGTGRRE